MESILLPTLPEILLALYLLLVLGALGSPMLSLVLETFGHRTRKIFALKLAQQVDRSGVILLLLVLLGGTAANALLLPDSPYLPALQRFLSQDLLLLLSIPFLLLLALWTVRALTWNRLKKRRPLHILLGVATVVCLLAVIVALAGVKRHLLLQDPALLGRAQLVELFAWPIDALIWPALAHVLIVGVGAAAALSPLYLFLRRNREDYGRDYYSWSMGVVARWALIFMLGQLVLLPWYFYGTGTGIPADLFPVIGAGILSLFLAGAIWLLLIRSRTPLRYKGLVLLSVILAWAGLLAAVMAATRMLDRL
jgi:hypothetical protein